MIGLHMYHRSWKYQKVSLELMRICEISISGGSDASVLGSVEAPDLFGARYAWIAGAAKQDDGSILVALTQDRDDDSATELLLYRLSGF